MPLIAISLAFSAGIWFGIRFTLPIELGFLWMGTGLFLAGLWRRNARIRLAGIAGIAFGLGFLRFTLLQPPIDSGQIVLSHLTKQDAIQGNIIETFGDNGNVLVLRLDSYFSKQESRWTKMGGDIIVYVPPFSDYNVDDRLEIRGRYEEIANTESAGFKAFLERHRIISLVRYPQIRILKKKEDSTLSEILPDLRKEFSHILALHLPEPHASVAQGLLLGQRKNIPSELNDAFRKTGTSHILAISGFNITLLISFTAAFGRMLVGTRRTIYFTIFGIVFFLGLVGPSASVIRATIMGILVVLARRVGRQTNGLNFLAIAGLLMLLYDPLTLQDVGFQLSFMATVGLLLIAPLFEAQLSVLNKDWLSRKPGLVQFFFGGFLESTAMTLAATVITLPLLAMYFQGIPLISPLSNLIILPVPGTIIACSLLLVLLDFALPILVPVFALINYILSTFLIESVRFFASFDSMYLQSLNPDEISIFLYYTCLFSFVFLAKKQLQPKHGLPSHITVLTVIKKKSGALTQMAKSAQRRTLAASILVVLAGLTSLVGIIPTTFPKSSPSISFLNVGQGEATFLRTSDSQALLIDGGPQASTLIQELDKRLPLFRRRIDLVVLTHPHEDHLSGLLEVIERYEVGLVIEGPARASSAIYNKWEENLSRKGVRRIRVGAGQQLFLQSEIKLDFLGHEQSAFFDEKDLNTSVIMPKLTIGDFSVIISSDTERSSLKRLAHSRSSNLRTTLLQVPHHGAEGSLDFDFLKATNPSVAIISVGKDNRYGHPSEMTVKMLEDENIMVFRTDQDGSIDVEVRADGIYIYPGNLKAVKLENR